MKFQQENGKTPDFMMFQQENGKTRMEIDEMNHATDFDMYEQKMKESVMIDWNQTIVMCNFQQPHREENGVCHKKQKFQQEEVRKREY